MSNWRPRPEPSPALWRMFCEEWFQLSHRTTEHWWQAVQRSRWSRATELRSIVMCQAGVAVDWQQIEGTYRRNMGPTMLIAAIEDLVTERRLTRSEATMLEEAILKQTDKDGQWKGVRDGR